MDEKELDSSPSNDNEQHHNETISPGEALETPGELPDGDWTFVTQAHFDPTEPRDLTTTIIRAIADAEGVPITDVKNPPIYEVVDIAAIDAALFGRPGANRDGTESTVEFRYNEYKVTVEEDGWVTVSNRSSGSSAAGEKSDANDRA